jgi:hypothetical protein
MISVTVTGNLTDDPHTFTTRVCREFAITEGSFAGNPRAEVTRG